MSAGIRIRTDRLATSITTLPLNKTKPISVNHLKT
jgi:hypothetical protein